MVRASVAEWLAGRDVAWSRIAASRTGKRLHLPVYPFDTQEYWHTVEHGTGVLVAELHAGQADVAAHRPLELDRVPRLAQPRFGVEHLGDAGAGADRLLQGRHALPEHAQRPDQVRDVRVEGEERAEGQVAGDHAPSAEPEHAEQPEQREELERRHEDRVETRDVERACDDRAAPRAELARERTPCADALDDADAGDRLLHQRGRSAPGLLQPLRLRVIAPRVGPAREADQGQRDQDDDRQPPVDHEQDDCDGEDRQHVADRVADRVHHPRHVLRVRRRAAHQLAGPDAVVVARVEPQCVREDRVADASVGACAVTDRVEVAHGARRHLQQADA